MLTSAYLLVALAAPACPTIAEKPACEGVLPVYEAGCASRWVCPADLAAEGLTRVDLSDAWTPFIFREAPELGEAGRQPYRPIYRKLAAGQVGDPEVEVRASVDRYLEPYGIFPTLTVVQARLGDAERHACHDAVEDAALGQQERVISAYDTYANQRKRMKRAKAWARRLQRELRKRYRAEHGKDAEVPEFGPADFEGLAEEKKWKRAVRKWRKAHAHVDSVRAMQDHLRCDRLLTGKVKPGLYRSRTQLAIQAYQRKHMLGARAHVNAETRETLAEDSRELDFRALLRALRERVVAATGLIEDGSALGAWGTVLGRRLDTREFRYRSHGVPLANGAPDAISPATEAAAKALGWTSPAAALERLAAQDVAHLVVAIALPPPPAWHADHMDLRAEVDRGDVWYQYPVDAEGKRRSQPVSRRPHTTLYARHGESEIALVRWPTTIGAWKSELDENGATVYKYKNSGVGKRVWRTLVSGPSWMPPPTTPVEDLVERGRRGRYQVKKDIIGPSYASAYGLVMLIHERRVESEDGTVRYYDHGIRSHGSVSYRSIIRGNSHGCHRLFNHMAVRLGTFLLRHRKHTVQGLLPVSYLHAFEYEGQEMRIKTSSRGFGYQLDPPVPVEVLRGRIRGGVWRVPQDSMPIPGAPKTTPDTTKSVPGTPNRPTP